jgi:hypothetical protein
LKKKPKEETKELHNKGKGRVKYKPLLALEVKLEL